MLLLLLVINVEGHTAQSGAGINTVLLAGRQQEINGALARPHPPLSLSAEQ